MFDIYKILKLQGKQYIPDVALPVLPALFRGRPVISTLECKDCSDCVEECPTEAIQQKNGKISLDLGKCVFCGDCQKICPSQKIQFTNDYKTASNSRKALVIQEGEDKAIQLDPELIRKEIASFFGGSLKLRQVSAGGDNADEYELNACSNVNFDMGRFGIDWVASPRHADGIVITGPITENMAEPLQICYDAVPNPKIVILAGTHAISGGIFAGSKALDRTFLTKYKVDLFVPGSPVHPLTFLNGVLELIKHRQTK